MDETQQINLCIDEMAKLKEKMEALEKQKILNEKNEMLKKTTMEPNLKVLEDWLVEYKNVLHIKQQKELEEEERAWKEANGIVDGEEGGEEERDPEAGVEEDVVGEEQGMDMAMNESEFYDDGIVGQESSEPYVGSGSEMMTDDALGIIDATDSLSLGGNKEVGTIEAEGKSDNDPATFEEKKEFASTV